MADENKKIDVEKLLAEARRIQKPAANADALKTNSLAETVKDIKTVAETVRDVKEGYTKAKTFWNRLVDFWTPTWNVIKKICAPLEYLVIKPYKWMWKKTDYKARSKKWSRALSHVGRIALLAFTFDFGLRAAATVAPAGFGEKTFSEIQSHVSYFVSEPVADFVLMNAPFVGVKTDTVYLNAPHLVDHDNSIYTVSGCLKYDTCNDESSLFYKVQPRLMHNFWKLANKGNFFFIPDQEVGPITSGAAPFAYEVVSYGIRERFFKRMQWYPEILSVERIAMPESARPKFNQSAANDSSATTPAPAPNPAPAPSVNK